MASEIAKPELTPVLLAEIGFSSGTVYAWSGYGDLVWGGKTYTGTGTLGTIEPATDTSDLSSQGCVYTLEGVSTASLSLAIGDSVQGMPAKLYLGCLDSTGALISDPVQIRSDLTDVPHIEESGETCSISINCENKLARLSTPASRRFTADDQAIDYPGDRGFDFVPSLQDSSVRFGS
jgi:hypothetical protein